MSITLKSNDNKTFSLPENAYKKSPYLQKLISEGNKEINLDEIKGEVLEKVVEYLKYYSDKDFPTLPEVLKSNDLKAEIGEWDFSFINPISYENCFHLINAGSLLQLNHLYELACSKIAAFMKGKTPDEVNKEFTIECQLTQDEAKELGLDSS